MPHSAADFTGAWHGHLSGATEGAIPEQRHKLDKEMLALILNVAGITLTNDQLSQMKQVINDRSINMHQHKSQGANKNISTNNETSGNRRSVSDRSAVIKVMDSFADGGEVTLTAHEADHMSAQVDVLKEPALLDILEAAQQESLHAAFRLVTHQARVEASAKYNKGKLIDERRLPVSEASKGRVRESAEQYQKQQLQQAKETEKSARSSAGAANAMAHRATEASANLQATIDNQIVSYSRQRNDSVSNLTRAMSGMSMSRGGGGGDCGDGGNPFWGGGGVGGGGGGGDGGGSGSGGRGSRSGSDWDHFRSNVWQGGSRSDMSAAYKDWKGGN